MKKWLKILTKWVFGEPAEPIATGRIMGVGYTIVPKQYLLRFPCNDLPEENRILI